MTLTVARAIEPATAAHIRIGMIAASGGLAWAGSHVEHDQAVRLIATDRFGAIGVATPILDAVPYADSRQWLAMHFA